MHMYFSACKVGFINGRVLEIKIFIQN